MTRAGYELDPQKFEEREAREAVSVAQAELDERHRELPPDPDKDCYGSLKQFSRYQFALALLYMKLFDGATARELKWIREEHWKYDREIEAALREAISVSRIDDA